MTIRGNIEEKRGGQCEVFLLAQAAAKGEAREAVRRQLQTWQEADFVAHIDRERLHVYQLLAGQIDAVAPHMNLDWRRALGLHLWCGSAIAPMPGNAMIHRCGK